MDEGPTDSAGRLHRTDPSAPGYTRVAGDDGVAYLEADGTPITDPPALARIRHLAIPPAWREVWISPDPLGHLQATGIDAASRRQYLYHELWREQQDRLKFEHMERFAQTLPSMRAQLLATMDGGRTLDRARVLACSVRLLDVGMFRIGSEVYEKEDGHLGLATIARSNVAIVEDGAVFDYIAKEGVHQVHTVHDRPCVEIVAALKRRRGGGAHLLAFRESGAWHAVHAHLINEQLKALIGASFSAKNFRTWNGTLLAAVFVARSGAPANEREGRHVIARAAEEVSGVLGNTAAVARSSYIDPRVFERYLAGQTVARELEQIDGRRVGEERRRAAVEEAVLGLLGSGQG
jgi:DNA topoisomerase IB